MVTVQRVALTFLLLLGIAAPALAAPPVPPLTGRVVDLAHVLDQRTVDGLTKQLADHEALTTNQIVVVTLPGLQDYPIEQWGAALLNGWGIGQRDKDNGVVLVVAPNDRRLRIEVGYGLQGKLTDKRAAAIIENEIIPRFKGGDLKGGITAGVDAILATIAGTYQSPLVEADGPMGSTRESFERYLPMVGFPLLFAFIVVMRLLFGGNPARRAGPYYRNRDDDDRWNRTRRNQDGWGSRSSGFSSSRSSGGGFSGGGGRSGGGGASGRW
jgi:uncharacterized protein